jgi:hypothetical protein
MYTIQMKNWFSRIHMPRLPAWRDFTARVNRIVRDRYFWSMVGLASLIALFVAMFVWSITHPELNRGIGDSPPYMMY